MVLWLALLLGYANPDAMLDAMEPRHVLEWAEFLRRNAKLILGRL